MLAQIINLSHPNVFNKYRLKYNFSWDLHHEGLFGVEIRKIQDQYFNGFKNLLGRLTKFIYCLDDTDNRSKILLLGNTNLIQEIAENCSTEPDLQKLLLTTVNNFKNYNSIVYTIKAREFNFNSSYVMGILNVTPDSFSDGGKYLDSNLAAEYGIEMLDNGADILDIGGESSRPGADSVSAEEEIQRVIPVIQKILLERPSAIISVDTTKNVVASAALQNGASIVNDISSLTNDPKIADTIKKFNASLVLMHMLGEPKTMQRNPFYENVIEEIYDYLHERICIAEKLKIQNIFIDPGIGFGKTVANNLEILHRLGDFKSLGYPILIGLSRKSFLGKILDIDVDERDTATSFTEAFAVTNGARIIRTHNIKNGSQVCKMLSSLI
ncbi:MAG: dihydropteroate synthase [Ignavibacteriaceae bacterium]|nr:dihydropteroate synthase [Ignavibacteriaceae bacterium]